MKFTEKTIRFLEEHIPELADLALKQAYWTALSSGSAVLVCRNGNIIEIHPDGSEKIIKKFTPPIK